MNVGRERRVRLPSVGARLRAIDVSVHRNVYRAQARSHMDIFDGYPALNALSFFGTGVLRSVTYIGRPSVPYGGGASP
ncbi:hypothetical protein EC912_108161 [Luteibacter rhizovicinus]|uniref:Uncharacterized protein n=1 Tax=Luteibacter rhizovicinus TaxID=242606 RepID=A0A4R3YIX4_9GAMM|nr:hypothetical protein EC912_108161 [Luteibacter rhizovicinus]